jgi:ectoine hydroxylase-related dioxygenase (phytanoyl-CoA dioxygenase family)
MKRVTNTSSGSHRRSPLSYQITEQEIQQYDQNGYIVINDVLTEEEMQPLDYWFDHFTSGKEAHRMAKDFCDMSQPYGTPIEDFQLVNAMLPSYYRPELKNNIYFQLAHDMANQLYTKGKAELDYEQFLAKKPAKKKAEFAMHQDLGYWPKTKNTWTATFSLALSDSDLINGCLQLIPGTNKETELRKHVPKQYDDASNEGTNRDDSHTLVIETHPDEEIIYLPVKRGSITIHDERIVHGSAGNNSSEWRKTYIMAFRDSETIKEERAMGFTHSHNDDIDWSKVIK